ncbi:MAG: hypothetical protein NEA02_15750 [Thermoanaerobaculia bacterium]|nr:hypothetical protein [Thermoanaerobaculia bacterium]
MRKLVLLVFVAAAAILSEAPGRRLVAAAAFSAAPLTDMGAATYLGFAGGLYPGGNLMPIAHGVAGAARAASVTPLDANGNPSAGGKIVMVSIGMSNTTQEFCNQANPAACTSWSFVGQAAVDPAVNHATLVLVNGAASGKTAPFWISPALADYDRVRDSDLTPAGLTEKQVQIGWVKVANAGPTVSLPSASSDAYTLETQMGQIVRAMKARYPNLRLVYFSSRIYAGYATTMLNPEPYAYEYGFAVKWIVQAQIDQMANGGTIVDSRAGDLNYNAGAPWIGWGPYLWASGATARSDGLTWQPGDLQADGTHPSQAGQTKAGGLLLSFFKAEPTARPWFLAASPALSFHAASPCRVADTRNSAGPLGGPALSANGGRSFQIAGQCGVSPTAKAAAMNVTVTAPTAAGSLRLYPADSTPPATSTISYSAGQTRADNAVLGLGPAGDVGVHCDQNSGTVHVILDVVGWFE